MRRGALVFAIMLFIGHVGTPGASSCVPRQAAQVASGSSPSGDPWTVAAVKRRNGDRCDEWLFQLKFRLPQVTSFAVATTIRAGGHTPRDYPLSGLDSGNPEASERVFGGYVGRDAVKLRVNFTNGSTAVIEPAYPPAELRRRFVWMRGFRFFVHYYPASAPVRVVAVYDNQGSLMYRARPQAGFF